MVHNKNRDRWCAICGTYLHPKNEHVEGCLYNSDKVDIRLLLQTINELKADIDGLRQEVEDMRGVYDTFRGC